MKYLRRVYLVPSQLEEALAADLWLAGTLGTTAAPGPGGRLHVEAWFPADAPSADLPAGVELVREEEVADADWLARYRETVRPFPVAATLFIDPREPDEAPVEPPAGRRLLRIPARAAFGIGSHESTSLALELLEETDVRGRRVLDVGAGTGILAMAALLGGAASAVAFDVDLTAPVHARENASLNDLHPRGFAGTIAALREVKRFDLALVNVVPEEILHELPAIVARLTPGGEVILSGILAERGRTVLDRARALGLEERARRQDGDWVAFRLAQGAPAFRRPSPQRS